MSNVQPHFLNFSFCLLQPILNVIIEYLVLFCTYIFWNSQVYIPYALFSMHGLLHVTRQSDPVAVDFYKCSLPFSEMNEIFKHYCMQPL